MTITDPAVEALIRQRLQTGAFENAEDAVRKALEASSTVISPTPSRHGSLKNIFEAARGLVDDVDFSRNPSFSRPVNFS